MYNLIIVDDEVGIRDGLSRYYPWDQSGFQITGVFANGKLALDHIEKSQVDVVLSDIKMPHMDGITLIKKLRELNLKPKVVLLSGYAEFKYAQEAIRYGASDYILKPVQYDVIMQIFSKLKEELDMEQGSLEPDNRPLGYYSQIVDKVVSYMEENCMNANLEAAAALVSLSPNYLSKVFKRKMNQNFSDYLLEVKMKKAAELLQNVNYKTYEIASMLGYDNPKNFSRAFKNRFGMSPREYREQEEQQK